MVTPAAEALGTDAWACYGTSTFIGSSYSTSSNKGAYTKQATVPTNGVDCGSVGVAYSYRVYSGSPLYWSPWKYGANYAQHAGTNIIVGGAHQVTVCAPLYECGPVYT